MLFKYSSLFLWLLSGIGIYCHSNLRTGKIRKGYFCYYTNLSNCLLFFYEAVLFLSFFTGQSLLWIQSQTLILSMTLCIWVTHIIYHFVLLPQAKKDGKKLSDVGFTQIGNLFAHYIVPLSTLLQWFFLAPKDQLTYRSALCWLILPMTYFIFTMLHAWAKLPIGNQKSRYPYAFMDLDRLGPKRFSINILLTIFFFYLLGLLLVTLAHLLT